MISNTGMAFLKIVSAVTLLSLSSCAAVEGISSRMENYGRQNQETRVRLLLLNIVRAAYGEAMDWQNLASVLGTATANVQLGGSVPIIGHQAASAVIYSLMPQFTASGGPQFTTQFFNTKEFQSGIQAQIDVQVMKTYIDLGYPMQILLPLFVSRIEVGHEGEITSRIDNFDVATSNLSAGNKAKLNAGFNFAVDQLARAGLSIGQFDEPIGPVLVRTELNSPKSISDALAAGFTVQKYALGQTATPDRYLTDDEIRTVKGQNETAYWRVFRKVYRFCFDERTHYRQDHQDDVVLESSDPVKNYPLVYANRASVQSFKITVTQQLSCNHKGAVGGNKEALNFVMRSTEGVVRFLGEVAKVELGLDGPITGPFTKETFAKIQSRPDEVADFALFQISKGEIAGPAVTLAYDGATYAVPKQASPSDYTSRVMTLVLELINLNNSAKDQPAPAVTPVIVP